jgi:hypothetical protein
MDDAPPAAAYRLADSTSVYLRLHAHQPVAWWPWGDAALAEARARDVPVLLSVGYATCHWCHVMARESFDDPEVGALMNEGFVSVKVDREARPDVDAVYMSALQMLTGSGGWPMTLALTPDGRPWYAGTYFPPDDRFGRPSFRRVLRALTDAWRDRRAEVERAADEVAAALARLEGGAPPGAGGGAAPRRQPPCAWRPRRTRRRARCWPRPSRWCCRPCRRPTTRRAAASGTRRSSRRTRPCAGWSSCPARPPTRCATAPCARSSMAASPTSSAARSTVTRSTARGRSRTSRSCSSTRRRCCRAWRRPPPRRATPGWRGARRRCSRPSSATCCATTASSPPGSTPRPAASRAPSTPGPRRSSRAPCPRATTPRSRPALFGVTASGSARGPLRARLER